eukprot:311659_1
MGNKTSCDVVNWMDGTEQLHFLVHGYCNIYSVPTDIVILCLKYIETMPFDSRTLELLEKYENAQKVFKPNPYCDKIRLHIVGEDLGKFQLVNKYFGDSYYEHDTELTAQYYYSKMVEMDGFVFYLDIEVTTESNWLPASTGQFYRQGQIFVYTYDITNRNSFDRVNISIQRTKDERYDDAELFGIIVGTGSHLESERNVTKTEAMNLTLKYDNLLFMEVSSKENVNVKELFEQCVKLWVVSHALPKQTGRSYLPCCI